MTSPCKALLFLDGPEYGKFYVQDSHGFQKILLHFGPDADDVGFTRPEEGESRRGYTIWEGDFLWHPEVNTPDGWIGGELEPIGDYRVPTDEEDALILKYEALWDEHGHYLTEAFFESELQAPEEIEP